VSSNHTKEGRRSSFVRHAIRSTKRLRPQRYRMSAAGWLVPVLDDAPPVDDIRPDPARKGAPFPWALLALLAGGL